MTRLKIYSSVFLLLNLAFIPLMSLYGLRVCPVLNVAGFTAGCTYSGAFVALVLIINFSLLFLVSGGKGGAALSLIRRSPLAAYSGLYLASTLLSLAAFTAVLKMNHISGFSRAPEVLLLASVLIGLTQAYGLNWVFSGKSAPGEGGEGGVRARWLTHILRVSLPLAAALLVLAHFLLRQSGTLNRGHIAPPAGVDGLIGDSVLLIGFLFLWLAATYLFHFLEEKSHADSVQAHLEELQSFNFSYRSGPSGAWGLWAEILGRLNQFAGALAERHSLLNSFSRFVGKELAGSALKGEIKNVSGEEKELAILMSDIRGFTALSEKLPPAQVAAILNTYFGAMLEELAAHGLTADKFVGDGILAYTDPSSAGAAREQAAAAVDACLAMLDRLVKINVSFRGSGYPELAIGMGLSYGLVALGLVGSEAKLQYTVIGDAVNRAARLEGLCKEAGTPLVIPAEFRALLDDGRRGLFKSLGGRRIKGIENPVEIYGLELPRRESLDPGPGPGREKGR
ncbi:MAG: adenylate/guanylate cyclase domain-containing protein [Elusimicrobiota bacterium]|nr:adenylate/guanylate cyclase domain-containing protein [Elusimicrobiota bacterium]